MYIETIKKYSNEIIEDIINTRRYLHSNPELSFQEFKTSKFIKNKLLSYGIETHDEIAQTGVKGILRGKFSGKTIAIRADMDALPVLEMNKNTFNSKNKGVMHACGHDLHMSIVLGVAKILSLLKNNLYGNIIFIFQPGEEGYAGAKKMISEGILSSPNVDSIIATHVSPNLKTGQISVSKGPAMASNSKLKIIIKGKGGHAAQPNKSINPILIASNLVDLINKIVVPNEDPLESAILTITSFNSGNTYNVIPEEAIIRGTVRSFNSSLDYKIFKKIDTLIESITKTFDVEYKLFYEVEYPPVINDEEIVDLIIKSAKDILAPKDIFNNAIPLMLAEDFAYYTQKVPGALFHLGCLNVNSNYNLHSNKFNPDENCIQFGLELIAYTVLNFLDSPKN
ncbi:MAG: M20 family metallopeptidase [Clostridiales bacterium]